jgi:CheY-like chemotaxis protein
VLCVDDNPAMLDMLKVGLPGFGYHVDVATNGREALQKLSGRTGRFQVVITDIRMPGLSGVELIEHSRAAGYAGPFVVCAAQITDEIRQRLRELGVQHVIDKPARMSDIISGLRQADSDS